jgi:hypothetical protein
VWREGPKVLPAIEALLAAGTEGEAADRLGIIEGEIGRVRSRLGQLAKSFLSGAEATKAVQGAWRREDQPVPFPAIGGQTS